MRLIIRNFIRIFQRFKLAMTLNILGLSVAFTAFMIIMMQWRYDMTFEQETPNADCIYRVDALDGGEQSAIGTRPMSDAFIQSSPHIVAGAIRFCVDMQAYFTVEDAHGTHSFLDYGTAVTPEYTDVFTFDMVEGSTDALQVEGQALIPLSLARKAFGNESAIGKRLATNLTRFKDDGVYYVGGVYRDFPRNSALTNTIYVPLNNEGKGIWGAASFNCFVRLDRPEAAKVLLDNFKSYAERMGIAESISEAHGYSYQPTLISLEDLHFADNIRYDRTPKSNRATMVVLFTIAWVILIIAAINFTNFNTALSPIRMKNINTQRVLGSTVGELRRNLTIETVLVSFCAYVLSVYWLYLAERLGINSLVQGEISIVRGYPIVLLTGLVSLLLGAVAGIYPAYYMTSFQPALVLKGSFGLSQNGRRLRTVLMSAQFVTAFALIIASILMSLQNRFLQTTSLGYDKENLIVAAMSPKAQVSMDVLKNELEARSDIQGVSFASKLLCGGDHFSHMGREQNGKYIYFSLFLVMPSFLDVIHVPITEGRNLQESDLKKTEYTLVISQMMADRYELKPGDVFNDCHVVGIAPDVKFASLRSAMEPMAFCVQADGEPMEYIYVQTAPNANLFEARKAVEQTLMKLDADYPSNVRFFDTMLETTYQTERNLTTLITLFSLLAVFISIVGVFGMVVFDSEYKRKEIGIRKVLGSTTAEILVLFNKGYVKVLALCFLLAAPCAWYGIHVWLQNFAYKIPIYWWVFPLAFLLISLITVATVTYQNWHAANENPVNSIKNE